MMYYMKLVIDFLAKYEVFKYRWNGIVKNLRDTCVTMAFIVTASMQIGISKNIYDNKKSGCY